MSKPLDNEDNFKIPLTTLLNLYGIDSQCNTPDHELADLVIGFLRDQASAWQTSGHGIRDDSRPD